MSKRQNRTKNRSGDSCAHVVVEVDVVIVLVVVVTMGFVSSATGGRTGSTLFGGGEALFGRLAFDSVGELADCEGTSGGVAEVFEVC